MWTSKKSLIINIINIEQVKLMMINILSDNWEDAVKVLENFSIHYCFVNYDKQKDDHEKLRQSFTRIEWFNIYINNHCVTPVTLAKHITRKKGWRNNTKVI